MYKTFSKVRYLYHYQLNQSTPQEIKSRIIKLHNKKSPGYDQINNTILNKLTNKSIIFLTHIYNAMLRLSYFPPMWKFATIILICKPEKPKHLVPNLISPNKFITVIRKTIRKINT